MTVTLEEMMEKFASMEKRLQVMEDIESIKQLHKRYMNAHTFVEVDDEIACYSENATLDIGEQFKGKAAIADITNKIGAIERPKHEENPTKGAFIVHPIITVDGDKATGRLIQYELEADPDTHESKSWFQAIYDAEYLRENGEWKISYLKWRPNVPKMDWRSVTLPE